MRRVWLAGIAALALFSAACTSTLQHRQIAANSATAVVSDGGDGSVSEPAPEIPTDSPGTTIAGAGSPSPSPRRGGSRTPVSGGVTATTVPGRALVPLRSSQGITSDSIKLGVVTLNVAGLQDAKGLNNGDSKVQAQAVIDHMNATGGIAGRKIVPVFVAFEATSSNWESDYQAMCTSLTEDHKVFAVVNASTAYSRTFVPCLSRHNTPLINSAGGRADDREMRELSPFLVHPGGASLSRTARFLVDGLAQIGYFSAGAKVGLIRVDDPAFKRATDEVLKPRLAGLGVKLAAEATVAAQTSLASTASQMPSLVLRFQQSGIDRVLFLDNATLAILFTIQAGTQGYAPRYGLTTSANPALVQQNAPASGLKGAVGVGWQPSQDVYAAEEGKLSGPTKLCSDIMAKAGQGGTSRTGHWVQRMYCDELFFLRKVLDLNRDLTPTGLAARIDTLGTSFESAMTFSTRFGPGRRDGVAAVRTFAFDDGCSCFRYTSPPKKVE